MIELEIDSSFICTYFDRICNLFIYIYMCIGGGYVISPVNHGRQSAVKHMLAIDWNFWKVYVFTSSAKYVTINMLGRIAGSSINCIFLFCFLK